MGPAAQSTGLLEIDEPGIAETMAAAGLARSLKSLHVLDNFDLGVGYEIARIVAPLPDRAFDLVPFGLGKDVRRIPLDTRRSPRQLPPRDDEPPRAT